MLCLLFCRSAPTSCQHGSPVWKRKLPINHCIWPCSDNDVLIFDIAAFRSRCTRSRSSSLCWSLCSSGWPIRWSSTTSWSCSLPLSNWTNLSIPPLTGQRKTSGRPERSRQRRKTRSQWRFCTVFWSTYTSKPFTPLARYVNHSIPHQSRESDGH